MLDYLAIGHIAQDLTPGGLRLGGTVAYAALTARALGLRAGIVTAAAPDAVMEGLENVLVHCLPSSHSTTFENRYGSEGRTQILHARAEPLTPSDVPVEWQGAPIIHLAPLVGELDAGFHRHFPQAFVGLTPQGWLRQWDETGHVSYVEWTAAAEALPSVSATVISIEDVIGDWPLAERWAAASRIFVVTQGEEGATIFDKNGRRHLPAPSVHVVDPTGAGDIFAACFFVRLWQTHDPVESARFAVALASDSVTRIGLDGIPNQFSIHNAQVSNL